MLINVCENVKIFINIRSLLEFTKNIIGSSYKAYVRFFCGI